jgi:hypothetical protein
VGRYKGHAIYLNRANTRSPWIIQVVCDNGCYAYDGPWKTGTVREAILEALRGAMLHGNITP